jgi:anti-anti-sigma factor
MRFALWLRIPFLLRLVGVGQRVRQQLPLRDARTLAPISPSPSARKRPEPALRLEVVIHETWKGPVVQLRGEAGVSEAQELQTWLLRLAARRSGCVTFDLSELVSVSSLALGILVAYRRGAVRTGTRVCLAPDLHPAVRKALNRAGLRGLFETDGSVAAHVGPEPAAEDGKSLSPSGSDVQRTDKVTWDRLVGLEPQVQELLWRARIAGAHCRTFLDVQRAFGPVRNELVELIGFAGKHRRHPVLGSVEAYQVAYGKLYDAVAGLLAGHAVPNRQSGPAVPGSPA